LLDDSQCSLHASHDDLVTIFAVHTSFQELQGGFNEARVTVRTREWRSHVML
jgi:hypothetical protein